MDNKFLEQIRAWHLSERQSNIRRTFELGDLIITAVINTKLSENEVIRRIMADLGELAMGLTTYNRAARMARVFSQNQRAVLIEKLVSLDKAEILAGGFYDGRKRIKVISEIKSGKIKSPWGAIQGKYEVLGKPKKGINPVRDIVDTDSVNNPDNIVVRIKRDGEIDEESILNTLKNIVSRIGIDRFGRLAEQAKREVGRNPPSPNNAVRVK